MSPAIRDAEIVYVKAAALADLRVGDIVLLKGEIGRRLHRLVVADVARDVFITRGDCAEQDDPAVCGEQILGVAEAKDVRIGRSAVRASLKGVRGRFLCGAARGQRIAKRLLDRVSTPLLQMWKRARNQTRTNASASLMALLFVVFAVLSSTAQVTPVAVDSSSSGSATLAGAGSPTLSFPHTTTATGTNLLLIVGVSVNITNAPTTALTAVTYNGLPLIFAGAHNDTGKTRRVEMWYQLAPASGAHPVVVTINIPAAVNVGVVAGATTFTGVDQTVPLGSFVSADGAAGGNTQLDVPSVVNGMILDTMATDGTQTVTVTSPQVPAWNVQQGNNTNPGVRGTGSTRTGAPSVPISESFSGTSNWSLGAVSINPTTADIGVSTSVSAVALGQNSVFNITVRNNGLSQANNVTLTDTWAATNVSLISVVPSAGTCTAASPIVCTLPTPFASGAPPVTIAVTVKASAAGFYPNTATVTDSPTSPPDPNPGNNTYIALAPVVNIVCTAVTLSPGGTLTGVLNTYYPGTASVAAGATAIPVGTATGAGGTIANGSLLLVIQMQDAGINTANSVAYGNGSTGSGFSAINNSGNYEFVKATGAVSGGSVPITGAGIGGGLVFGYTAATASATKGKSTYQIVLVPQYLNATLSAVTPPTAAAWNGSSGGVLALDIAQALNLGGATVSVNGLGFRGGAGMQLSGGVGGTNTDFRVAAPAAYTGASTTGVDGAKGEGVAGTPFWVQSGLSFLAGGSGYPSGTATDGSMARGAPGNAGGGGTDGDPTKNDQNAGGGGGGNGGSGGFGGDSWTSNLSSGGEGGAVFPATIDRLALGGGGGAGARNDDPTNNQASSAAAGGGIIFLRANSLAGTGTLTANGASAYNGTLNDAGGGGGSGGTIVILTATGGESGLTLNANGGNGGNAWQIQPYSLAQRHGPGGGGGGGLIFVSGAPAGASVSGGASGLTLTPGVPYGATAGNPGASVINATLTQVTGVQSAALCTPDVTLGKSHVGNFTRGLAASYTIPVSNVGIYGPTSGVVTINDTLPTGITPTSAAGPGWTCSVSAQTVSCARSDPLPAASAYPSIAVNALVSQSSPASLTNTAVVGGGGEANLLNDIATDVAIVGSSADMMLTDSGSPNPVVAGSNITYTQAVTNTGPSAADNATMVSPIPANTTFVSIAVPAGWSCTTPGVGNTGNVVCTNVSLAASTAGTFNLVVKVAAGTSNGTVITDTVSVNSSTADPNSANNAASVSTLVGTSGPDLTVTNAALPNPVQAGANITYTQVVTNTGTSAATTATFTETTPANTAFVSITPPAGWTCAAFPPQCTDASVAAGASGTFTVVYKVLAGTASGTPITDTVTVNAANQSFGANSATATDIVATATQADVALATVATPSSVISGNNITYTQAITNNGPAAATGLSFTEATPVNTTFASVSAPAGWTCTQPAVGASGNVNCTTPNLAAATAADIIVVVNVPTTVTAGTITANSTVTTTSSDPTAANNSTTVATPVTVACDLAVTNSGTPSPVSAGGTITYTQTVTNSGPSNCSAATFSEPTPANTTFVSVAAVTTGGGTWTCPNTAPVACTNPTVVPGSKVTITAVYNVNGGLAAGTIISDTASAATTSNDTNQTNNSVTLQIAVASATQADLRVTNSGSPNPVSAGSQITYTQSVSNAGPAAATTVSFTDPIPANTTVVSLTAPGWACSTAPAPPTCTIATLAAGTTANFTFVVTVNTGVAPGTTITQTDSVTSAISDPTAGNNSATATVQVSTSANLSVTDTASPIPVLAGANITYTQVVTNAGPSAATTASLTENIPANTTYQSIVTAAGWSCITPAVGSTGQITCTNPSFASGSSSFTVVVQVTAGTIAGTAINDTATVSSSTPDPNPANNTASAADVVATAGQADLITTNSALPTSVAPGSNVTYTQTVTNNGPAIATGVSFTQTTPPNTTFQSITPPAGWTCGTVPAVGGTGTITCTDGSSLAINGSGTFAVVLQVISATPSGTNITETATATATNVVPSLTSNSATATVVVAGAGTADVAIVKTATPSPTVPEGDTLTYTLTVTNNGPATATNVIVTDPLPTDVTFLSVNTTAGTCSEAGGTVTCLLGTMANAANATVSILTLTAAPGTATNTATVSADQTDPIPNNNTSTQTETITAATSIKLESFSAQSGKDKTGTNRVVLLWKTGREVHNLGFNIYREQGGERVQLNPSLIAGSALLMSGALPKHSGKTYAWIDSSASAGSGPYWLEDVEVNGTRILHGPVSASASSDSESARESMPATSAMLHQLNQVQPTATLTATSHPLENISQNTSPTPAQYHKQFDVAAHPAVKIYVKHEGWYRVTQPELVTAGLDPNVDPAFLHLYVEAIEQPIEITDASVGPGGFGPQAAIYFYGTGIDTQYSGTRVYFLAKQEWRGTRIHILPPSTGSNQPPASFPFTVELTPRTTYFSALTTANGNNFFGPIISSTPVDETIQVSHLDRTSTEPAQFDVILQGVILAEPHSVNITLNKTTLGDLTYSGQVKGRFHVSLPPGLLQEGANTITFTSQDGAYDYSLVQSIRVTYPHTYVADADELIFTGRPGDGLKLSGFSQAPVTIVDITNPNQPVELMAQVTKDTTSKAIDYQVEIQVPWSTTNPSAPARHTLIALADSRIASAVGTRPNHPSHWHSAQSGSDIVIVSPEAFAGALGPVIRAHEAEAKSSSIVFIDDLYDEFNFGQHSPVAIRTFLETAVKVWHTAPHYLLLNGRASFDPRNYLGLGHLDFVPTKIVATTGLMTASDDWFSDFKDSSIATIATGRLPVSTAAEAKLVAGKVATYEGQSTNGPWTSQALMVADMNDTENFAKDSQVVQAQLPSSIQVTDVFLSTMSVPDAQQAILTAINAGQLVVNYSGHGSEDEWSGDNLFDASQASALTNGTSLPVFLIMDCLNGFFQDVYEEPLAVSLMLAPGGGAVAVLASSGLNQAAPQTTLDKLVVEAAMGPSQLALGDAILKAKSGITNPAVRKTYNLLGDPAMQIKPPVANPAH
jgi:uncharacterized repeat protein (TIGR01451 family)